MILDRSQDEASYAVQHQQAKEDGCQVVQALWVQRQLGSVRAYDSHQRADFFAGFNARIIQSGDCSFITGFGNTGVQGQFFFFLGHHVQLGAVR